MIALRFVVGPQVGLSFSHCVTCLLVSRLMRELTELQALVIGLGVHEVLAELLVAAGGDRRAVLLAPDDEVVEDVDHGVFVRRRLVQESRR